MTCLLRRTKGCYLSVVFIPCCMRREFAMGVPMTSLWRIKPPTMGVACYRGISKKKQTHNKRHPIESTDPQQETSNCFCPIDAIHAESPSAQLFTETLQEVIQASIQISWTMPVHGTWWGYQTPTLLAMRNIANLSARWMMRKEALENRENSSILTLPCPTWFESTASIRSRLTSTNRCHTNDTSNTNVI